MVRSTALGQALDSFANRMLQAQQLRQAQQSQQIADEVNAARFRNLEADTRAANAPLDAMQSLGAAIQSGNPAAFSDTIQQNASDYLMSGVDPTALSVFTPDANTRAGLFLAGGNAIKPDTAFSLDDREAVAARQLQSSLAEQFAKPVGINAGQNVLLGAGDPRGATLGDMLYGRDTASTAEGKIINDLAAGNPVTPAAAAVALPQSGSLADGTVFGPSGVDGPLFSPLGKTPTSNAQQTLISTEQFKGTINRYRELIRNNPDAVGAVGNIKGLFQDVQAQADAMATSFGFNGLQEAMATARADLQRNGVSGFDEYFNPNIPQAQQMGLLMAYSAASAVADQTGRGLSDKDLQYFQRIVGNPGAWTTSANSVLAKLDTLETEVDARISSNQQALQQGVSLGESVSGNAPVNPGTNGQVDYIFNPTTGKLEPAR